MDKKHLVASGVLFSACLPMTTWSAEDQTAPTTVATTTTSLEDIVVTAQRREERLVDVPISVTALSGDQLAKAGVENVADLAKVTPGLTMPFNGGFLQPAIRGISSTGSDPGDGSNVAIYVDGVYQPSQSSQLLDLPDVSEIEVLKGPQGTLFGQNAAGGAITITTLAPSFTPTGKITVGYGRYNDQVVRGYVSDGITDTVAVSLSGGYERREGYNRNLVSGGNDAGLDSKVARAKLLWQPQDGDDITFTAYYFHYSDTSLFTGQPLNGDSAAYQFVPTAIRPTQPWSFALNPAYGHMPVSIFEGYGGSVRGVFDIQAGQLSFVSAYSVAHPIDYVDYDFTAVPLATTLPPVPDQTFTQEVNFASKKWGGFSYTAGFFYMHDVSSFDNLQFGFATPYPTPFSIDESGTNRKDSAAAYAEFTYEVTDKLSFIAGVRHSVETQLGSWTTDGGPEVQSPYGSVEFSKTTPRFSAKYAIDQNSNVYATYSQGFKSGVVDIENLDHPPVKPENVTAYEVGYKGVFFNRLSLNAAAFHYLYKDIQVQIQLSPGEYGYENAAAGKIDGFELDSAWQLSDQLRLNADLSYLRGIYTNYANATIATPIPGGGNNTTSGNVTGNDMIRTPRLTGDVGADYEYKLPIATLAANVNAHYSDGYYFEASDRVRQAPYTMLDAGLSYAPAQTGWKFTLWGKNLTNKAIVQSYLSSAVGDGISYALPCTFGVKADYSF